MKDEDSAIVKDDDSTFVRDNDSAIVRNDDSAIVRDDDSAFVRDDSKLPKPSSSWSHPPKMIKMEEQRTDNKKPLPHEMTMKPSEEEEEEGGGGGEKLSECDYFESFAFLTSPSQCLMYVTYPCCSPFLCTGGSTQ